MEQRVTKQPPTHADLTLEQKADLLSGRDFWSTQPIDQHDVPSVVLTDGPHGLRLQEGSSDHLGLSSSRPATCFPLAVAVGSSWGPEVARRIGSAIGREARAQGVHVVLGPGVNIKRSPLGGRNFEYYSEDPLLSGVLGSAHVQGQQSEGVGASVKHFAVNNQETDRMRVSADVDERTLREIYLPAFERVVTDAAPASVMCSYNRINGTPAAEHHWLLTDLLRGEWGFEGVVVSDWGAVQDTVASVRAGLDLEMPGTRGKSARALVDAVRAGDLDEDVLDRAVDRVLAMVTREVGTSADVEMAVHHALARDLAAQCAVLLKNDDDALPLSPSARIAVVGEIARTPRFQGLGSSRVAPTAVDVPLDEIRALVDPAGGEVRFAPGYTLDGSGDAETLRSKAEAAAHECDVAVIFVGTSEDDETEGDDRTHIDLPADQVEVIRSVARSARRSVVVLSNGSVVSMEGWVDEVDAVLEGFLLGQASGGALADLLLGVANPSGRLAESIPVRVADGGSFATFPGEQGHSRYGEGVLVGYRWHDTVDRPARFAFGHGLSYTTFETTDLAVELTGPDTARATVSVSNTGSRPGARVVQVYVATDAGPVKRPLRELRAFGKVLLEPGESRTLELELPRRAFAYWDVIDGEWAVAPGDYAIQVCQDSRTVLLEHSIRLAGDSRTRELTLDATVDDWLEHPDAGPTVLETLRAALPDEQDPDQVERLLAMIGSMPMGKVLDMAGGEVPPALAEYLPPNRR